MKNEDIIKKLDTIHVQSYLLDDFTEHLQSLKQSYVSENDQEGAKRMWIYQTVVEIHQLYRNAFSLLKNKSYYEGWCQLEKIEITINNLRKHLPFEKNIFYLRHIERAVKNLQVIFPYCLFASVEILKKRKKCSICDKEISIRNPCGHIVGDIYNGEMCYRIVTEADVLGMALVENPGNKFSVMFLTDDKTGEKIDHYNYDTVSYLFECLNSPYELWNLEVSQKTITKEDYGVIGRNTPCSCGSGRKFKQCCMKNIGKTYPHYEFLLENPSSKVILTNTVIKTMNEFKI